MALAARAKQPDLGALLLKLLPPDGAPVLNRIIRVLLAREARTAISAEHYVALLEPLLASGRIGRLRGQGGQIFLARDEEPEPAPVRPAPREALSELKLMPVLGAWLAGPFRAGLDLGASGAAIVEDTSAIGPRTGRWARPDFILVSAMRFRILPQVQIDVHSFELKTETGASVLAVHEALAQTRFSHFGHVVWHLPAGSRCETQREDIANQCKMHGVGLILLRDPAAEDGFEIVLDPVRKATPSAAIDGFLETRLSSASRRTIARIVAGRAP